MSNVLSGGSLAGGISKRGRATEDYYATEPRSVKSLLEVCELEGDRYLEPCIGGGHIARTLKECKPEIELRGLDLVDRGCEIEGVEVEIIDFFKLDVEEEIGERGYYDNIVTNPPYKHAQAFIEKSLELVREGGKVAMFLKIQFLEGVERYKFYQDTPPKEVYVFASRQSPMRDGRSCDEKGKPWGSTMCFGWFVWEKGYKGSTEVKWLKPNGIKKKKDI